MTIQVFVVSCDLLCLNSTQNSILWAIPIRECLKIKKKDDLVSLWKHVGLDVKAAMRVEDLRSTVSSQNRA